MKFYREPGYTTASDPKGINRMWPRYGKIALLHHVGGGNLGDDATLDAVVQNIRRRKPGAEIAAFTANPEDTRRRHGLLCYPIRARSWSFGHTPLTPDPAFKSAIRTLFLKYKFLFYLPRIGYALAVRIPKAVFAEVSFLLASRRNIESYELLIISGGGQLTEWGGPLGFPYTLLKWVYLAKSAGIKCLFLNVGAGPLNHPLSKFFVKRALGVADYISFRDEQSRKLVSQIGFKGSGEVFPDCVYSREVAALNGSHGKLNQLRLGIAPMPYCDPRTDPAEKNQAVYHDFIARCATFAASLVRDSSCLLTLFGTDIGVDPLAIEDLHQRLLTDHRIATPEYRSPNSIDELLSQMSGVDYIVTCRFHGVIFAHLLNKPVLALSHHPKVMTIMNDLGLSKYCVDIRTFDPILLVDKFKSLVADTDEVKRRMAASLAKYKSQSMRQFDELFAD
jgi:polysaccharide pyruvyl transferase WcaK-like protein